MIVGKLIKHLVTTLLAIFFILGGIACLLTPWSSAIRTHIILFIIQDTSLISGFGLIFTSLGISLIINIIITSQHSYYLIKYKGNSVKVDENLIHQLLENYLKELFPGQEVPSNLILKNNILHFTLYFPYIPSQEQKPFLERVESELVDLLSSILGYNQQFSLAASFRDKELGNKVAS